MSLLVQLSMSQMVTSTRNGSIIATNGLSTDKEADPLSTPFMSSPQLPSQEGRSDTLIFQERISPSVKEFLVTKPTSRALHLFVVILILVAIPGVVMGSKWKKEIMTAYPLKLKDVPVSKIAGPVSLLLVMGLWSVFRSVKKESAMFISSVGVQVKQFNVLGWSISSRFFPKSKIKALVINETIRRQRVVTYLALILNSPDENGRIIIPLFSKTLPRLSLLTKVYRDTYALLTK